MIINNDKLKIDLDKIIHPDPNKEYNNISDKAPILTTLKNCMGEDGYAKVCDLLKVLKEAKKKYEENELNPENGQAGGNVYAYLISILVGEGVFSDEKVFVMFKDVIAALSIASAGHSGNYYTKRNQDIIYHALEKKVFEIAMQKPKNSAKNSVKIFFAANCLLMHAKEKLSCRVGVTDEEMGEVLKNIKEISKAEYLSKDKKDKNEVSIQEVNTYTQEVNTYISDASYYLAVDYLVYYKSILDKQPEKAAKQLENSAICLKKVSAMKGPSFEKGCKLLEENQELKEAYKKLNKQKLSKPNNLVMTGSPYSLYVFHNPSEVDSSVSPVSPKIPQ